MDHLEKAVLAWLGRGDRARTQELNKLKVVILTVGTRGDVQPYVALGRGMRAGGWDVVVATTERFKPLVQHAGLKFASLQADFVALLDSPQADVLGTRNPFKMMREIRSTVFPMMRRMLDDAWDAAQGADLVVYHPKALAGVHITERLGIPCVVAPVVPLVVPTRAFPAPGINVNFGRPFNRLTYTLITQGTRMFQRLIDDWRRETLGLGPASNKAGMYTVNGRPVPVVHGVSEHVVPRPADWPEHAVMTGFWTLEDEDWSPPASLEKFLTNGEPPVYIGFGSVSGKVGETLPEAIVSAVKKIGVRAVVAFGPDMSESVRQSLPGDIYPLDRAPHTWLFPHMAAVVHHGGAGTVAAGLRAGKPTVVCPLMTDQPFWARRVYELGVGPRPVPLKKLTADRLAEALHTALNDSNMIERAHRLGRQLQEEDGVGRAVAQLERWVHRFADE